MAQGRVRLFYGDEGWGSIASQDLPSGQDAWVHFSVIEGEGYRTLSPGDAVEFEYEEAEQDGFAFRATRVMRRL